MSGITIEDELQGGTPDDTQAAESPTGDNLGTDTDSGGGGRFDLSILKARTGEGPVEAYVNHPLNFNESRTVARIIRGATGLMGELDFALVDIGMGLLEYMKGRYHVKAD